MAANTQPRPSWETSPWRTFQEPITPDPPSVGNVLGTIAIAIGIGMLGAYMLDLHTHTCEACGNRWRHLGAFNLGDPTAHTCVSCGTVQWWKDGTPHVFRDALRQPPPKTLPDTLVSRLHEIGASPRLALSGSPAMGWPRGLR